MRSANGGVGFSLRDDEGRTLAWNRKTRAGLPPLLFDGELTLADGTQQPGMPFLSMMGLARAATEGGARIGGQLVAPDQIYLVGLDLCLALRSRNPALGANPYVEALQVRCTDGLTAMRQPVPDTTVATVSPPRSTPGVPLAPVGDVRRVTLQPRWSRPVALGEDGGRILLGKRWITVHSPHAAHFVHEGRGAPPSATFPPGAWRSPRRATPSAPPPSGCCSSRGGSRRRCGSAITTAPGPAPDWSRSTACCLPAGPARRGGLRADVGA